MIRHDKELIFLEHRVRPVKYLARFNHLAAYLDAIHLLNDFFTESDYAPGDDRPSKLLF